MKRASSVAFINVLAIACIVLCYVAIRKLAAASNDHGLVRITATDISKHWIECPTTLSPPVAFDATLPFQFRPRQQQSNCTIPSIVHFSFGMADGDVSFGLIQYLSLISALHVLGPQRVLIHYDQRPSGIYWDMLKDHVQLEKARKVTSIFGNPVGHYAHKADIIRLEALLKYGGIYLDMDVFVLRPFDAILVHDFVMGREQGIGLCNAVILANKESPFLRRWYESYRDFNQSDWNRHSVRLPAEMARSHPDEITVLDDHKFFWPLWTEQGRQSIYFGHDYDYASNLAVHTWNSASGAMLRDLSMASLLECRSSLFSVMRMYVPKNFISVMIACSSRAASDATLESLQSLLKQSWTHWEALLVGDTRSIRSCEEAIGRLSQAYPGLEIERKFRVQKASKQTSMTLLDRGVEAARGSIVVVLKPGQAIISPHFLIDVERAVAKDPQRLMYAADHVHVDNNKTRVSGSRVRPLYEVGRNGEVISIAPIWVDA
jgi:hypothetical protein